MTYEEKLAMANVYLTDQIGLGWDDLPDVNSLHDAETIEDVILLCNDRINSEGEDLDLESILE